ncbi:MAG: sigma-70 family RNA polymerase sigma factor [Gemmatimonadota bacterium]
MANSQPESTFPRRSRRTAPAAKRRTGQTSKPSEAARNDPQLGGRGRLPNPEIERLAVEARPKMLGLATRLLRDSPAGQSVEPDDLVQKALVKVVAGDLPLRDVPLSRRVRRLLTAVAFEFLHLQRDTARHRELLQENPPARPVQVLPEKATERSDLRARIDTALDELPPRQCEIARKYFLDSSPTAEIADDLGVANSTVKNTIRTVRRKLRQALVGIRKDLE